MMGGIDRRHERDGLSRRTALAGSAAVAMTASLGRPAAAASGTVAFAGARVIDGTGRAPIENATIVAREGTIVAIESGGAVPAGATVVDARGSTIVPALIDAHTHVGTVEGVDASPDSYGPEAIARNLETFRRYGVAAIMVMGTDRTELGVAERRTRDATAGDTNFETAGAGIGAVGGFPPATMIAAPWIARPATPEDARAYVRTLAASSPDVVKLWVDSGFGTYPTMPREISAAIIDEAHRHGLRAAAHLFYLADAKALVAQGLDVIAHSVRDAELDDAFLGELRRRDVAYVTTLALDESQYVYADDPPPAYASEPAFRRALQPGVYEKLTSPAYVAQVRDDPDTPKWRAAARMSKRNAKRAHDAGIRVALGTDSGATFERIRGFDTHRELELYVESGIPPLDAIRYGTANAASVLGPRAAALGALEPGKRANLLVLDGDPLADVTSTRRPSQIWLDGIRVASWREA